MDKNKMFLHLVDELKKILDNYRIFGSENEFLYELFDKCPEDVNYESNEVQKFIKSRDKKLNEINSSLSNIYNFSKINAIYFFDCSTEVYKKTLSARFQKYRNVFSEATIHDFYLDELQKYQFPFRHRKLTYSDGNKVDYSFYLWSNQPNNKFTVRNKIKFLKQLLEDETNPSDKKLSKRTLENGPVEIFKGSKQKEWFISTLIELNALSDDYVVKKGFQTAANTIYLNTNCAKEIFKFNISKTEFIKYLNTEFDAKIKSKHRLPDATTFFNDEVNNHIKLFK